MRTVACVAALLCFAAAAPAAPPRRGAELVPGTAVAAGVLSRGALEWKRLFLDRHPQMKQELGAFLTRTVGLDLSLVEGAVFYSSQLLPAPEWAVFLELPGARALKAERFAVQDGVDLYRVGVLTAALVPGGLLVGTEGDVRAGVEVHKQQRPPLGAASLLGRQLEAARDADLVVAVAAAALAGDPAAAGALGQLGVQAASLTARLAPKRGLVRLDVLGDAARLDTGRRMLDAAVAVQLQRLADARTAALDSGEDVAAGVGAIVGYHQATALWRELAPRLERDRLVVTWELPDLDPRAAIAGIAGVAAAVAIPAFVKYVRRAKTVEATAGVRQIAEAARRLAAEGRRKAGFTFPRSTGWTPAGACCGQPGDRCQPGAAFDHPTWKALGYQPTGPLLYQVRFTSSGRGKKARFTVEARGDLDCDGRFSSFSRAGGFDRAGDPVLEELRTVDETE